MGLTDRLNAWSERKRADLSRTCAAEPRVLTDDEQTDWLIASRQQQDLAAFSAPGLQDEPAPMEFPTTLDSERMDFIEWVGSRHPGRLRRIGRDLDWLRMQARAYGLDPKEVRWLI